MNGETFFILGVVFLSLGLLVLFCYVREIARRVEVGLDNITRLQRIIATLEQRTSFYVPRYSSGAFGTSGGVPVLLGSSMQDDYVGVNDMVGLIMKRYNLVAKRAIEDVYLISTDITGGAMGVK